MHKNKKAFTLIELLVVVLIIGILSAIALPQYTKAVEKARMTQALVIADAGKKAVDLFLLENDRLSDTTWLTRDVGYDLPSDGGSVGDSCAYIGENCNSVGDFVYTVRVGEDLGEANINIIKIPRKNRTDDGGNGVSRYIEYKISYLWTPAGGWTKSYTQESAAKANLKPDFAAMGFTTN